LKGEDFLLITESFLLGEALLFLEFSALLLECFDELLELVSVFFFEFVALGCIYAEEQNLLFNELILKCENLNNF
jgi:hypothetical protein